MSTSSSSSSSSSSEWISSSSSKSTSSSSSTSESTSSSSSSIDSSSTSSESEGNVSSSSSSSVEIWNQSKPLILANSAISSLSVNNRLSQAITLFNTTYDISKVYCYLYSSKQVHGFNIYLSLCNCNNNGSPSSTIMTVSLDASTVTQDGWYGFNFNYSGTTPSNQLISFVMWQDGGNEDNYVMWGYSVDIESSFAWFSDDATIWENQLGVTRAIKIVGVFDVFDLNNFQVDTPPAITREIMVAMNSNSATFYHTQYLTDPSRVELDQPDLIMSFIIDSSGSMGWNDRLFGRKEFITNIVQRFVDYYPSNVLFDIVKFGSRILDASNITANMGQVMAINLDIRNPDRSTYVFTTETPVTSVKQSAIYSHNGFTYSPNREYTNETEIAMIGNGIPLDEGTLQLISGTGDSSIVFNSTRNISVDTSSFVALGFKNLENTHEYNFAGISVDNIEFSGIDVNKWQMFYPSTESPTIEIGNNGPRNSESVDIIASTNLVARSPFGSIIYESSNINNSVALGATSVIVSNSAAFIVGDIIDLVDSDYASINHTVTSIIGNTITFTPSTTFAIENYTNNGGRIQDSVYFNKTEIDGTTIQLYLRDILVSKNITLFMQTVDGYFMEWDIYPNSEWFIYNLYWLGETALLPISLYDNYGVPYPNGTRIDLEVDTRSSVASQTSISHQDLTQVSNVGSYLIYVESIEGLARDEQVTLVDNIGNIQILTIEEVGELDSVFYIRLYEPLIYTFDPNNGATIVPSTSASSVSGNSPVPIPLTVVDVTPIVTQKSLDPSYREVYDPPEVPISTTYEELNNTAAYMKMGFHNIPSIDGSAVIRILPITEDVLKTAEEKAQETSRQLRMESEVDEVGQVEQESGDLDNLGNTQTTTTIYEGKDYSIESPIYSYNGEAQSSMTTSSVSLTAMSFDGIIIPGYNINGSTEIFVREYTVYPSVTQMSSTNVILARQYIDSFLVDFTPPYNIISSPEDKNVSFWVPTYDVECGYFTGYEQQSLPGAFVSENSDGSYTIEYIVTNKFILEKSATIRVRLYSNKVVDVEALAANNSICESKYYLNVQQPPTVTTNENGEVIITQNPTNIDQWRTEVSSNQFGTIAQNNVASTNGYSSSRIIENLENYIDEFNIPVDDSSVTLEEQTSIFYTNASEWTLATQYEEYDLNINVVNGRASFTLPANEMPSVVFVEASIEFGGIFEAIRTDIVVVANPIIIGPLIPHNLKTGTGETFELSSNITWKDGSELIDDGVLANIVPSSTNLIPKASVTDKGWIKGLFIGPHSLYTYVEKEDVVCPPIYLLENIVVTVSHPSGYTAKVNRLVAWEGEAKDQQDSNIFYFYDLGGGAGWADGSNCSSVVTSDLFDSTNLIWIEADVRDRLMGYNQIGGERKYVSGNATSINLIPSRVQWSEDGKIVMQPSSLNKNVGYDDNEYDIKLVTGYRTDEGNFKYGEGVISRPDGESPAVYPTISFTEPLGISVELEAYDSWFIRDGSHSPNVVATVTWQGEKITKKFIMPITGEVIDYPMPSVIFKSGICVRTNENIDDPSLMIDGRATTSDCLDIGIHSDATLSTYGVETTLSRTDKNDDGSGNIHTHACVVDNDGNGSTNSTIVLEGAINSHNHQIVNFIALAPGAPDISGEVVISHSHELRSVAITQLNPTTNTGLAITINGYVVYDPTNATPYKNGVSAYYLPTLPSGNRMMFSSLKILGYTPSQPELQIIIESGRNLHLYPTEKFILPEFTNNKNPNGPSYFTALNPTETSMGFDIRAIAKFSSYTYENYPGHSIIIPERIVDDGSRISFELTPYKPQSTIESGGEVGWDSSNVNIVAPDLIKKYMIIKGKASIAAEGFVATRFFYILINSNIQWLPGVSSLMPELSNDVSYITSAMTKIDCLGASQLHDAVKEATQRIIQEQTDTSAYKSYEKVIVLLTDGDENTSMNSLNQAINNIQFIDGTKETPVIGIQLGNTDTSDEIIMKKYSVETGGSIYPMVGQETIDINNLIDSIIQTNTYGFNYGTFKNLMTFEEASIPIQFNLGTVSLPSGTTINYRTRYSSDGENWTSWTSWKNSSATIDYDNTSDKILQYQYEVRFLGNKYFESPLLYGSASAFGSATGPLVQYNKPQTFIMFFKPISIGVKDSEYLSSVHITHEAYLPETSSIDYGLVQSGDLDTKEYLISGKYIEADKYAIMLTRYNEILITSNYKNYSALNGRWPKSCNIEIYRFNDQNPDGILVNSSEYSANSILGTITFFNHQELNDNFSINVIFDPSFRLIAKITNYAQDAAIIHHLGLIYNIATRIPKDKNGNIIHKPISKRLS